MEIALSVTHKQMNDEQRVFEERYLEILKNADSTSGVVDALDHVNDVLISTTKAASKCLLDNGIIPRIIRLLNSKEECLIFKSALCLNNFLFHSGFLPSLDLDEIFPLVQKICSSDHIKTQEIGFIILANIASESSEYRETLLLKNVQKVLHLFCQQGKCDRLESPSYLVLNLCRKLNGTRAPEESQELLLRCCSLFADSTCIGVKRNLCWSLVYLSEYQRGLDFNNTRVESIIRDRKFVRIITDWMKSEDNKLRTTAVRAIGNLVTGTHEQTQIVLEHGILSIMKNILEYGNPSKTITSDIMYALSNLCCGNRSQLDQCLESGIFSDLSRMMGSTMDYGRTTRKNALCAGANFVFSGSRMQLLYAARRYDLLKSMCVGFMDEDQYPDNVDLIYCLDALFRGFEVGGDILIGDALQVDGFLDKLRRLRNHMSLSIRRKSNSIINSYFVD